jgi:hypothetical protein
MLASSRFLLAVLFGFAALGVANADYISNNDFMPCLTMQSQPETIVAFPHNVWARNFTVQCVSDRRALGVIFSSTWDSITSYFDISLELSSDGGQSWQSSGVKHSHGFIDFQSIGQNSYNTYSTIDDSWGTDGLLIGQPFFSHGSVTIEPYGSQFRISSFVDFYTVLSVDGGDTWEHPTAVSTDNGAHWQSGNLPVRLEGVPEPGTLVLLATGGAALLWWQRRRQSS